MEGYCRDIVITGLIPSKGAQVNPTFASSEQNKFNLSCVLFCILLFFFFLGNNTDNLNCYFTLIRVLAKNCQRVAYFRNHSFTKEKKKYQAKCLSSLVLIKLSDLNTLEFKFRADGPIIDIQQP